MHSPWDRRQSPIKQLSGATSADSGTTTAFQQSCPSCHHPLQVFIHQGDAPRWRLPVPAGPKPPGRQPRRRLSGGALASEGLKFQDSNAPEEPFNLISTFTPDTCGRRYMRPQHAFVGSVDSIPTEPDCRAQLA